MNKARSDGGGVVLPGRDSYRVNWSNVGRSSGLDRTDDEFLDREGWNRETEDRGLMIPRNPRPLPLQPHFRPIRLRQEAYINDPRAAQMEEEGATLGRQSNKKPASKPSGQALKSGGKDKERAKSKNKR